MLSDEAKTQYPAISWKEWCGIRDIFAHQYDNLDVESAWKTITVDLPLIKETVRIMLDEL